MKVCITGITGQTGSYLAEQCLDEGHEVYGLVRRSSTFGTERIDHIYNHPKLQLVYGDMADYSSLLSFVGDVKPDRFFNMAAQSHVRVSFDIPEYTFDVTGTGVLRALEAIRKASPETKFLQASTSEMFGSSPPPQSETTPFHPRSPYGAAKVGAYWLVVNYREAYNLHTTNSISFNHECIGYNTPLLVKRNGVISVVRPADLVSLRKKGSNIQNFELDGVDVWDGTHWTAIKAITATKYKGEFEKKLLTVSARGGVVNVTAHHNMLDSDFNQVKAGCLKSGDKLALIDKMPIGTGWATQSKEFYEFFGLMTADGWISQDGRKLKFTNNDESLQERVGYLWRTLFLGNSKKSFGKSGFSEKEVGVIYLQGNAVVGKWLRQEMYTKDKFKKVPDIVLNADLERQKEFIEGYYKGDGLKKGKGESFVTNSSVLAQGLVWMYERMGRSCSVYAELRNEATYYRVNVRKRDSNFGSHLIKDKSEVRKIEDANVYEDWVFDLETESGVFAAGVGSIVVHNSPRRGETFVTRKITRAATRIKIGLQDKLMLGNLDAKRDWTHASDVARGMVKMLDLDYADDFVIGSGEMNSVQEFLELVFSKLDMDWKEFVEFDPRYLRPSEVDALGADPSKLKKATGWEPLISFDQMVDEMIEADMKIAQREKLIKDNE